ncbi:MerR family DNA-binding transcriptional regulator [Micromonospora maritima]|uniref:MerR family DNA-binding transcriptional regulator n=1 Tax=Micromonospora maritima TaxID=986711 RepID=A0ABW7ZNU5_9ACTN
MSTEPALRSGQLAAAVGVTVQTLRYYERHGLRAAISAGCDDLIACAGSVCCPLPFGEVPEPR